MDERRLARDVRLLKAYAVCLTIACAALFARELTAQSQKPKFDEIDVERINIVEKDGKLRMVISNAERQHPGIVNGQIIARPQGRPPGLIFFDQRGEEMGGLAFGANGGNGHAGQLSWDKVGSDQTIALRHLESDNGTYETALQLWQRPSGTTRLFLGKRRDDTTALELSDIAGKPRVRLQVAADGAAKLEFLDEQGRVTRSIP